jgi:putative cell wall-binding protein
VVVLRRRSLKAACVFLCGALAVGGGVLAAQSASGTSSFILTRLSGSDRYATSATVAEEAFPTATTVILATGANYPDALAASFLAGNANAPILLTTPDLPLSSSTTTALTVMKTKNVIILGGTSAVSAAEQTQLSQTASSAGGTLSVVRASGATRYDTMEAIDTAAGTTVGTFNGVKTAFIATGTNFPDALGAGPVAYAEKFPIILTDPNSLSPQAQATLTDLGIKQVLILGGSGAVSAAVEASINEMGIPTLQRFAGVDRSQTSTLLADYAISNFGFKDTAVNVASGDQAYGGADALSSGPLGGTQDPVATIITDAAGTPGQTVTFATEHEATLLDGFAIGGPAPLPDSDLGAIEAAGQGNSTTQTTNANTNTTVKGTTGTTGECGPAVTTGGSGSSAESGATALPNLSSVSLVSLTTVSQSNAVTPAGTLLQFSFDKVVSGSVPQAGDFDLVSFAGVALPATATGGYPQVVPNQTTSVRVLFPTIDTEQLLGQEALAEVTPGAVETPTPSLGNPEGSAPIGGRPPLQSGQTFAPDLRSETGLRPSSTVNQQVLDLTFDCSAMPTGGGSYNLVLTDNTIVTCVGPAAVGGQASGGTVPGGAGTTVLTVQCPEPASGSFAGSPITQTEIARAFVAPGTVEDVQTLTPNVLESAGLTPTSTVITPDLTSVSLSPNQPTGDIATYTFDQPVLNSFPDHAAFQLFTQGAGTIQCAAGCSVAPGLSQTQVVVTFPTGTFINVVGASVAAGAVTGAVGTDQTNQPESYNAVGTPATGATNVPDLVSAVIASGTTVTFTYDKPLTSGNSGDFHLYTQLGAETTGSGPVVISGDTATVTFGSTTNGALATTSADAASGPSGTNGGVFGVHA